MGSPKCVQRVTVVAWVPWEIPLMEPIDLLKTCKGKIVSLNEETRRLVASLQPTRRCMSVLAELRARNVKFRLETYTYCPLSAGVRLSCIKEKIGKMRVEKRRSGLRVIMVFAGRIVVVEFSRKGVSIRVGRRALALPSVIVPSDLEVSLEDLGEVEEISLRISRLIEECASTSEREEQ